MQLWGDLKIKTCNLQRQFECLKIETPMSTKNIRFEYQQWLLLKLYPWLKGQTYNMQT